MLSAKLPHNLSYHTMLVEGQERDIAVRNSDNMNEKFIYSVDKNVFSAGNIIEWEDNHWLVTELDANTEVYTKAKIEQCNHLLKWINDEKQLCEEWCVVEDGTKYLTGEYEDRNFIVTRGDSRVSVKIAKNKNTVKLNRKNRFLIDDPDAQEKLAYALTKPFKRGWAYNAGGIYIFVLQEVASTDNDNHELGIADYYNYFPREPNQDNADNEKDEPIINPDDDTDSSKKKVWI